VRRREFITLIAGAATACPLAGRAQQPGMPVVGFLCSVSAQAFSGLIAAFREGLNETGYSEGRNVAIEFRFANGDYDQLPSLAADLVRRQVAVIVAGGGAVTAIAAKKVAPTVPIVFGIGEDPIKFGLVDSLSRPGGNITGVTLFIDVLSGKRLQLLSEVSPSTSYLAFLLNQKNPNAEGEKKETESAARAAGRELRILFASSDEEIDAALSTLVGKNGASLIVGTDTFFFSRRGKIVDFANRHAIPAVYFAREFARAGGLMSYGTNFAREWHQVGIYTGRILRGTKPSDLAVTQPTKFEFVINLKTARALAVDVPPNLLALADEVID
jgi:putative ABC transport system substrate-binding protein